MQPIDSGLAQRLDVRAALRSEAERTNALVPETPGLAQLASFGAERLETLVKNRLRSGLNAQPMILVNARKPSHTTRPAPILGLVERVAYRALVDHLLGDEEAPDRGPRAYADFVEAPVAYLRSTARRAQPGRFWLTYGELLNNPAIQYVVSSDIAAFYQYVDHGILSAELMRKSNEFAAIAALTEILGSLSGRGFGIPQQNHSSDRLSEAPGRLLEAALNRAGFLTWRFNDDFRIGAESYAHALEAVEVLDEAARGIGLVVNDSKTRIYRIRTYFTQTLGLDVDDQVPEEVGNIGAEDLVAEYTDFVATIDDAQGVVDDIITQVTADDPTDLTPTDIGRLRRSLYLLSAEGDVHALPQVPVLAGFAPSATPSLARYLSAVATVDIEAVVGVAAPLLDSRSLSEWQLAWFATVLGNMPTDQLPPNELGTRLAAVSFSGRSPLLRATAAVASASFGSLDVESLERMVLMEPEPMLPWYVTAVYARSLVDVDASRVLRGLRQADELVAILVDSYTQAAAADADA